MSDTIEKIKEWKRALDDAKVQQARLEGAVERSMLELKTKFGCNTIKEAQSKHQKWTEEISDMELALAQDVKDFEETYGDLLSDEY